MRGKHGFTLVEVMIALVILMVVIVGFMSTSSKLMHTVTTSDRQEAAIRLAYDRIEMIRLDPRYTKLESLYVATETSFPTLPGFSRVTAMQQVTAVAGKPADFKKVTVTVSGPGLISAVKRTTTVAAP
jgi:prepilin-type N-terminal cleavage/methylation domain-containing protein